MWSESQLPAYSGVCWGWPRTLRWSPCSQESQPETNDKQEQLYEAGIPYQSPTAGRHPLITRLEAALQLTFSSWLWQDGFLFLNFAILPKLGTEHLQVLC